MARRHRRDSAPIGARAFSGWIESQRPHGSGRAALPRSSPSGSGGLILRSNGSRAVRWLGLMSELGQKASPSAIDGRASTSAMPRLQPRSRRAAICREGPFPDSYVVGSCVLCDHPLARPSTFTRTCSARPRPSRSRTSCISAKVSYGSLVHRDRSVSISKLGLPATLITNEALLPFIVDSAAHDSASRPPEAAGRC
jgi:hypothetical protein